MTTLKRAGQVSIFDAIAATPSTSDLDESIQRRFEKFHLLHPEVYDELVTLARQLVATGQRIVGIGQIFEVVRFQRKIRRLPDASEDFKLNNNYRSRYSRLIMDREPDLDGVFEVRELKTR